MLKESNRTGESGGNWTPSHWPAFSAPEAVSKKLSRPMDNRLEVNNLLRIAPLLPIDIGDGHLSRVLIDIAGRDRCIS